MKILDLKNSFVRFLLARKIEKIFMQGFDISPSVFLSDVTAHEQDESVTINAAVQIVMSKKDLAKLIIK